jgi:hypothetical protein
VLRAQKAAGAEVKVSCALAYQKIGGTWVVSAGEAALASRLHLKCPRLWSGSRGGEREWSGEAG